MRLSLDWERDYRPQWDRLAAEVGVGLAELPAAVAYFGERLVSVEDHREIGHDRLVPASCYVRFQLRGDFGACHGLRAGCQQAGHAVEKRLAGLPALS